MIFFTADHHFGHENIIEFCNRPFVDVSQMDKELILSWNSVVGHEDTVYHLGDFTLGTRAHGYMQQLNGRMLILGLHQHHDRRWLEFYKEKPGPFYTVWKPMWHDKATITPITILPPMYTLWKKEIPQWPSVPIVLSHFPMKVWDRKHYGAIHLHGHSHGNLNEYDPLAYDVGIDNNDFLPVSLKEIVEKFESVV